MQQHTQILRDQRGASFVEYLILVGVIAIVGIIAFSEFGDAITGRAQTFGGKVEQLGNN
ncbi:MAG TPA: hypothetical protein VJR89_25695 [Polyangiales bacterium]|nr:hypothetical protein [Polyangiales bacterium]